MAGTANDYIGTLSTTRSGRTCAKWLSDYDLKQMQGPNVSLTTTVPSRNMSLISTRVAPQQKHFLMKRDILFGSSILAKPTPKSLGPSKQWMQSRLTAVKPIHSVDRAYWNDSLYPERSVRNASNYCRDPSRNIAGTWCYTTDPLVPQDLCDIRDCEKPGEV